MHKKQIRPLARLHGYWLYRRSLAPMQSWPLEQRRDWLFTRLKRTLSLANEGVPFYRERFRKAGFQPDRDFTSLADLPRVPLLTKQDLRAHPDELIDPRFLRGSVWAHTSGTTGQPMALRLNEWYVAFDYACMFRHWAKAGYTFRAPFAAIRSYVPDTPEGPLWKFNWWQNTLYMSAYHLKPSNAQRYLEALQRFRPRYLRGYVSSLNVLAEFARPHRDQFDFVQGVFTASETLTANERGNIEAAFGPKLYDWYGMTEPAVVITERADHDGMEVDWEYGFAEFLEGPNLPGAQRRLVATSLHNPVMPLIRYETEDVAQMDDRPDSAGLYPRVRAILGRKDECILTPNGGRLPSLNFYSLLQSYTDILRFQFVQTDCAGVTMKIALRPTARQVDTLVDKVRAEVSRRLGPDMALRIEVTDQFVTSADGKTPTFKMSLAKADQAPDAHRRPD